MRIAIISREEAARNLAVSPSTLLRHESLGLVRVTRDGGVEGYEPSEIRRVWAIVSYQRDLGVNLAGVEAILKLRDRLDDLRRELGQFSLDLTSLLDETDEESGTPG